MNHHYHYKDLIFFVRPQTSDIAIIQEVVERDNYKITGLIKPHDIVIDIGGHIGSFSVFASSMGANVITYEPVTANFNLLKENVGFNKFPIQINHKAVMGKRGTQEIYIRQGNYGGSNMYGKHDDPNWKETVECITLDDIFTENKLEQCDFLKLDCEGAELEILENFSRRNALKRIALEYHGTERRYHLLELLKPTHDLIDDHSNDVMGTIIFTLK